jgi:hypothetical protein
LELRLIDFIGGFVVEINEHANGSSIAFLCTRAHPGKLQGSYGFLIVVFHSVSPFVYGVYKKMVNERYDRRCGEWQLAGIILYRWELLNCFSAAIAAYLNKALATDNLSLRLKSVVRN